MEKIYQENVPHKMSESEFWTMYFHSKYRHKQSSKSDKAQDKARDAAEESEEAKAESKAERLFGSAHDDREEEIRKRQTEKGQFFLNSAGSDNVVLRECQTEDGPGRSSGRPRNYCL